MSSEPGQQADSGGADRPQDVPRIAVIVEHDLLDEAARHRVSQVVEDTLSRELAEQPAPKSVRLPETLTIGRIGTDFTAEGMP